MIVLAIIVGIIVLYFAICAGVYLYQEICAEINNFKRWKRQTLLDLEWEWNLLRKDFERWHTE